MLKKVLFSNQIRGLSTGVKYSSFGPAATVLKLQKVESVSTNLGPTDVAVKMLAAPINPSDINMAEGVYGIKATLPAFGGNEGVAKVVSVGNKVKSLQIGDWVIPSGAGFGTWREEAVADEKKFTWVPQYIPPAYAATLAVNPATALRMLRDFETLSPGDVIIQNGANSMVGLAVIQLAKEMGVKTINIVRSDRPDVDNTLRLLSNAGGDVNFADNYLNTDAFREIVNELPPIKLGLNCVGGDVVTDMARVLGTNATMVTYGGMSKRPITIPYELLAYKQLKLKGFWISAWNDAHSQEERTNMLIELSNMVRENKLTFFYEMHDFDDFEHALKKSQEAFRMRKVLLNFDYPDRLKEHDKKKEEEYEVFETFTV